MFSEHCVGGHRGVGGPRPVHSANEVGSTHPQRIMNRSSPLRWVWVSIPWDCLSCSDCTAGPTPPPRTTSSINCQCVIQVRSEGGVFFARGVWQTRHSYRLQLTMLLAQNPFPFVLKETVFIRSVDAITCKSRTSLQAMRCTSLNFRVNSDNLDSAAVVVDSEWQLLAEVLHYHVCNGLSCRLYRHLSAVWRPPCCLRWQPGTGAPSGFPTESLPGEITTTKRLPNMDFACFAFNRFIDHRLDTVLTRIQNKKINKWKGKWIPWCHCCYFQGAFENLLLLRWLI